MGEAQDARAAERLIDENPDLFMVRLADARADVVWAVAGVLALLVFAVQLGMASGGGWGGAVGLATVFAAATLFKRFRFRASMSAGQVRQAGGLVIAAGCFAFLDPPIWVAIGTLAAVGVPKLVREMLGYRRTARRMAELGKKRKMRPANLLPAFVGLMAAGITAGLVNQGVVGPTAACAAAWLSGYSMMFAAFELWA